jgi:hypothetical protein
MNRLLMAVLALFLSLAATESQAGPLRRRASSTCQGGNCRVSSGGASSAQDVANLMAARGAMVHPGGNTGREGIGEGSSPEAALRSCCYHPQNPRFRGNSMAIRDQGVAFGHGRWFACIRE